MDFQVNTFWFNREFPARVPRHAALREMRRRLRLAALVWRDHRPSDAALAALPMHGPLGTWFSRN